VVLVSLLALGVASGTTQAAKTKKVASEVDIDGVDQQGQVTFIGNVYAKKAKCVPNRTVTILFTEDGGTTPEPVGTVTSDATGDWRFVPDSSPPGDYQAEVAKKKFKKHGKKLVCKPDISPSFIWAS
jgi:hypothetical protein